MAGIWETAVTIQLAASVKAGGRLAIYIPNICMYICTSALCIPSAHFYGISDTYINGYLRQLNGAATHKMLQHCSCNVRSRCDLVHPLYICTASYHYSSSNFPIKSSLSSKCLEGMPWLNFS